MIQVQLVSTLRATLQNSLVKAKAEGAENSHSSLVWLLLTTEVACTSLKAFISVHKEKTRNGRPSGTHDYLVRWVGARRGQYWGQRSKREETEREERQSQGKRKQEASTESNQKEMHKIVDLRIEQVTKRPDDLL